MNVKIIIAVLVGVLLIPLGLIQQKITERERYRQQAAANIERSWTGEQTIYTPFLVQKWESTSRSHTLDGNGQSYILQNSERSHRSFLPLQTLKMTFDIETEYRKRVSIASLFIPQKII